MFCYDVYRYFRDIHLVMSFLVANSTKVEEGEVPQNKDEGID
jgi:hypothetical protein